MVQRAVAVYVGQVSAIRIRPVVEESESIGVAGCSGILDALEPVIGTGADEGLGVHL